MAKGGGWANKDQELRVIMEKGSHLLWFQLELLASNGEHNVRHGPKTGTVHG